MDFQKIISEMTLEEKLGMIHDDNVYDTKRVERLGIPPFRFSDGPMGVRGEFDRERCDYVGDSDDYAASFPCPTAVAATWNPRMAYENGRALGREVRGIGRDVSLSPGINLHRTPLCGRSFEYMAEDPCLISGIAVGVIRGIQVNDVAACVKHFVANNQETRRGDVNVEIDERTFQELYLPGFQAAVQEEKSMAVMGAYNHMFDANRQPGAYNAEENRQAILKVARESIVLLKNDRKILPLPKDASKSILLVGENANRLQAFGGGSSEVRALFELTPLLGMKMHLGGNFHIRFAKGYSSEAKDEEEQNHLKREACRLAADSDIVIYVGGLNHDFDMEGKDREDMKLPYGQDELIGALLDVKPDMVVVNMSGSPVEMGAWIDRAGSVVQYWYSGTMGGTALAEVLFGDVNPSGKLPTTFPTASRESVGIDAQSVIDSWEDSEEFFEKFPSAEYPGLVPDFQPSGEKYLLGRWWFCLFERLWSIRGMENALMDFYLYPDEVHKLFRYITDFYKRAMERTAEKYHVDGFFVSDDIGTQTGPFFSLDIFRVFFKPYFEPLMAKATRFLGTHFY